MSFFIGLRHENLCLKFYENNLREDTFESLRTRLTLACLDRHKLKFRKLGKKRISHDFFSNIAEEN